MKNYILLLSLGILIVTLADTPVQAQSATITSISPVCNNDGVLVVTNTGNPFISYNYSWYTNEGTVNHYFFGLTDTLFNFKGGDVFVYVQPNDGTIGYFASANFPFPFSIIQTIAADTCPNQTGAISLALTGGVAPHVYNWTFNGFPFGGNTPSITNLTGGFYDCLVTDAAGCQMLLSDMEPDSGGIESPNVPSINNILLTVSSTPANCLNGTATALATGGMAPYSYLWSNGATTSVITGIAANTLMAVTVTDANNCNQFQYEYIPTTSNFSLTESVTNAHCTFSDGAITIIPIGGTAPYSYLWNTMATTSTITNIPSAFYTVTATDALGCIVTNSVWVNTLTPISVTFNTTASQCLGTTGSVTANVGGGTAPYTYEWFTTPVQTTQTATGLAPGLYNFEVTDVQGCTRSGIINIPQNTTLNMSIATTPSVCIQNNGTAAMNATGGVLPYTYVWSSSQTTDSISGMPPSLLYGTVTDADGCFITECENIPYQSPLNFLLVPQWASCIYTADGMISVNIINGTPPYSYDWSNGMTTPAISGLLPGRYSLVLTDANGCTHYEDVVIGFNSITPCTATLTGKVYIDLNGDCTHNTGEPTMENIPIYCSSSNYIDFTDMNGDFTFYVPAGTATLQQLPVPYRYQSCPSANPFSVNIPSTGIIVTQDIADSVDWVNDLTVNMWNYTTPPIVGSSFKQRVVEFNRGTNAIASANQLDFDSQAPFAVSTLSPSSMAGSQVTWNNALALPLHERHYDVTFDVPANVPFNTQLYYTDTIFPVTGDTTWWDNSLFKILTTFGSYDPNYKEVIPVGSGPQGLISPTDSILEFVIHFQNIGNYFATDVSITDMLDSDLEPTSLRVVYATHNQTTHISPSGLLEFDFQNIMLPSIEQDSVLSNGFVVYTIKTKPNLPNGTEITNTADIYFDANPPITTNTTLNTILYTGLPEESGANSLHVYPNPNHGDFKILFDEPLSGNIQVRIMNTAGQIIYENSEVLSNDRNLDVSLKSPAYGIYFLQVISGKSVKQAKVILEIKD